MFTLCGLATWAAEQGPGHTAGYMRAKVEAALGLVHPLGPACSQAAYWGPFPSSCPETVSRVSLPPQRDGTVLGPFLVLLEIVR